LNTFDTIPEENKDTFAAIDDENFYEIQEEIESNLGS